MAVRELHSCDSCDALRSNGPRFDLLRVEATKDKGFDLVADLDIEGEPSG